MTPTRTSARRITRPIIDHSAALGLDLTGSNHIRDIPPPAGLLGECLAVSSLPRKDAHAFNSPLAPTVPRKEGRGLRPPLLRASSEKEGLRGTEWKCQEQPATGGR